MYKERARDRRYLGMTAAMTQLPVPTATCPHGYRTTLVAQGAKVPGTFVPPTVDTELDVSYVYKNTNHVIRISTVDLNQEWQKIEQRLKEIIKEQEQ